MLIFVYNQMLPSDINCDAFDDDYDHGCIRPASSLLRIDSLDSARLFIKCNQGKQSVTRCNQV